MNEIFWGVVCLFLLYDACHLTHESFNSRSEFFLHKMHTYIVIIIAPSNKHWLSVLLLPAYEQNFNEFSFYVFYYPGIVIFLGL